MRYYQPDQTSEPVPTGYSFTITDTWIPFRSVRSPKLTPKRFVFPASWGLTPNRNIKPFIHVTNRNVPMMPSIEGSTRMTHTTEDQDYGFGKYLRQRPVYETIQLGRRASGYGFGAVDTLGQGMLSLVDQVIYGVTPSGEDVSNAALVKCGFGQKPDATTGKCTVDPLMIALVGLAALVLFSGGSKPQVMVVR